jgi:hypothetical protein
MDVRIETLGRWLHEFNDRFREAARGLSPEALEYAPAKATNSIGVLVRHAVLTQRGMLAGLAGQEFKRDLPGEFAPHAATAEELLALLDEADELIDELLAVITPQALSTMYPRPHNQTLTGAEWAVHTYGHVKEHVAHAELTRQLLPEDLVPSR